MDAFEETDTFIDFLKLLLLLLAIYRSSTCSCVPPDLIDLLLQFSLGHGACWLAALNVRRSSWWEQGRGAAVGGLRICCVEVRVYAPGESVCGGVM